MVHRRFPVCDLHRRHPGIPMKHIKKSAKLANVCYDIRGPVLQKAKQMEEEGH